MGRFCCVPGCIFKDEKSMMHGLPMDEERFVQWKNAIGRPHIPYEKRRGHRVCDYHFSEKMKFTAFHNRTNLKANAVPDMHLPLPSNVGEGTNQGAEKSKLIDEVTSTSGGNIDLPKVNSTSVHNKITLEDPTPKEQVSNQDLLRTLLDEVPNLPKHEDIQRRANDDIQIVETNDPVIDLCSDGTNDASLQPVLYIETVKDNTINKVGTTETSEKKDTFSLSPDNISKICRTCLKEKEVLDIYEHKYNDVSFSEIIELCTPIKLEEDAALSKNICKMCIGELLQAYDFRLRCDKSEKTLKAFQTELAKSIARTESFQEDYVPPFLPFHDYEATLNEEEVQNTILARKRANRKRFYLVKGPVNGKGIKLSEIDENNAKALINDNTRSLMTVRVGNALCNLTKGVLQPGQQLTKAVKNNLKNALVRNLNKRKMLAYSQWITPAIRSVIAGRPSPNVRLLKPKKPKKRKCPLGDKPKDRKLIFPGMCEICNEPYNNIDEYRHHANVTKHYLNPYVCEKCGKIFGDKHRLKTHWEIHHETNEAHMCEICGKRFKTRSYLQIHLKGHTRTDVNKEFKCKTCGDVYLRYQDLMLHNRKLHPTTEKKHCCEFCGEFFSRKDTLRHHRNRVHLKIKRQFCHICGKGYLYKSLLKKHMVVHSTLRFDCTLCNKTFKAEHRYMRHIKNQHPGTDPSTKEEDEIQYITCEICNKSCRNKQLHSLHGREDHDIAFCIYCDSKFETATDLDDHIKEEHNEIPDFSCRYCGRCFSESHLLYFHLQTHKPKYYECPLCYKKFPNSVRLKIHMVIHTKEKLYGCRYCDKSFMYRGSVVIHERLHTGERPYVCDICGKGNVCSSSYKRHRQSHTLPVAVNKVTSDKLLTINNEQEAAIESLNTISEEEHSGVEYEMYTAVDCKEFVEINLAEAVIVQD